jgi:cyanophycinase
MFVALLTVAAGAPAADALPPIANLVIGGGERRCTSYNGSAQGRDCSADWDTILAQDPAFAGLSRDNISFDADVGTPAFHYGVNQSGVDALGKLPASLFDPQRKQLLLAHLGQLLNEPATREGLSWQAVEQLLPDALLRGDGRLTLAEGAVLRSALVDRTVPLVRKLQGRSTLFSSNSASVAITESFVAAARAANGGKKPLIGVVTASAEPHSFIDHDINMFALASAGADVVYLPLEGGYRQALDAQDCANVRYYYDSYANSNPSRPSYHADLLFPDMSALQQSLCANNAALLNASLERLNGIYFSGGDQTRHLESLVTKDSLGRYTVPSAQLTILQRRHAQGQLVVAGTSAGNHFQGGGFWRGKPVPMVGGGDSYDVLKGGFSTGGGSAAGAPELGKPGDSIAYSPVLYPYGGLGVFHFGVLDSHFSKRTREARLVRAVSDSGMDFGFGVDENTALQVSQADATGTTHFSVVGAGGVFIVDVRRAKASANADRHFFISGARAHYLLPGDRASINAQGNLQVELHGAQPQLPVSPSQKRVARDQLFDYGSFHFLQLANSMGLQGAQSGFGTTRNSADHRSTQNAPVYSASLSRDNLTVFRGTAAVSPGSTDRVSYTELILALAPCDGACQATDEPRDSPHASAP